MKIIKSLLLLAIIFFSINASAQTPKLAHINSGQLLEEMPRVKAAEAKVQDYYRQLEQQLKTMYAEYQKKMQEYQNQQALMIDDVKEVKMRELQDLETRIREFESSAQEKLTKKREELLDPVLQEIEDAIEAVAKEQGYTYVFDLGAMGGSILYADESKDITPLVKKKLGL